MRKSTLSLLLCAVIALCVGFVAARQSQGSFQLEALKAEMKEAGPQYEAALVQYPEAAPRAYALYGQTSEFREVIHRFGHNQIIPIIDKCLVDGDTLLELSFRFDAFIQSLLEKKIEVAKVGPAECGWRAILLTLAAGNSFLGQYAVDEAGRARLLPGNSFLAIMKRLTTSGIQKVEKRLVLGESPSLKEWGLAALDVAVLGVAAKTAASQVLRRGVASRASLAHRISHARTGLAGFAQAHAPRIAKYATIGGVTYLAVHHPRVITGAAGVIADAAGIPRLVVQTLLWGMILFIPLWGLTTLWVLLRSVFRLLPVPRTRLISS
ncbi:MAG TPA: hypothetical protein VIB38_04780 [Aestuariivirgaceae bacterium]|jgi:hypothetical protein